MASVRLGLSAAGRRCEESREVTAELARDALAERRGELRGERPTHHLGLFAGALVLGRVRCLHLLVKGSETGVVRAAGLEWLGERRRQLLGELLGHARGQTLGER